MCDTNAFVVRDGQEELYLESVNYIKPEGEKVYLRSLFGEEKIFEGRIREISLKTNKVLLEG
jgi:predicted RNA-binding protein